MWWGAVIFINLVPKNLYHVSDDVPLEGLLIDSPILVLTLTDQVIQNTEGLKPTCSERS